MSTVQASLLNTMYVHKTQGVDNMLRIKYRKNSNIIRTIFAKNRALVAGVHIMHVN